MVKFMQWLAIGTCIGGIILLSAAMILELLLFPILVYYGVRALYRRRYPAPFIKPDGRHVLITGCDTGFGRMLTSVLDKDGYNVFALCLTDDGITDIKANCSDRVTTIKGDVTKDEDLDAAMAVVRGKTDRLHALVNNAGITAGMFIEVTSMEAYRRVMDVNYFAGINLTKKAMPLLIQPPFGGKQGRVVNVVSVAGFLAMQGMSAYAGSKHAFEAFSDCLRREMKQWGLTVSIIEPGFMKTPIIQQAHVALRRLWEAAPAVIRTKYGDDWFESFIRQLAHINSGAQDPALVVKALHHAVGSTQPESRYRPDPQAQFMFTFLNIFPATWIDKIVEWSLNRSGVPVLLPAALRGASASSSASADSERKTK